MRAFFVALSTVAFAGTSQAQTVRLATEGAYPPYNFVNDAGEVDGFEREFGDLLCQRAQLTCAWVVTDWASLLTGLQDKNSDAVLAAVTITPKRQEAFDFTQAYLPAPTSVFVAAKADADLKTGPVAAQSGTVQVDYLSQQGMKAVETTTADTAIAQVTSGQAVAALVDRTFATGAIEQSGGSLVVVGEPVSLGPGIGIALRKDEPVLRGSLDNTIGAMKCDGTLDSLILKWLGPKADIFGAAGKTQC